MTLDKLTTTWRDTTESHILFNETLKRLTDLDPELKFYRDWIESKIFGFGERSFIYMWKLIIDTMPACFDFLEIGVFRGQIIGLVRLLADREFKPCNIYGITPLTSEGGHWESDYKADINLLHKTFNLHPPVILKGLSTEKRVIDLAKWKLYNIIYIDGGHTDEIVTSDIINYSPLVKKGGLLVVDDCANKYNMPSGYFRGIEEVSRAVDRLLPSDEFKELFSVVHNRVFLKL